LQAKGRSRTGADPENEGDYTLQRESVRRLDECRGGGAAFRKAGPLAVDKEKQGPFASANFATPRPLSWPVLGGPEVR
jgi:hypothetical protein